MESIPPKADGQMSLIAHLDELRVRLMRYLVVLFILLLGCYAFRKDILNVLRAPVEVPLQKYSAQQPLEGEGSATSPGLDLSALECSCLPAWENNQLTPAVSAEAPTEDVSPPLPLAEGVASGQTTQPKSELAWYEGPLQEMKTSFRDFKALYLSITGREEEAANMLSPKEELAPPTMVGADRQGILRLDCACRPKKGKTAHMVYIGLPELFFAQMKTAIYSAIFFSFPFLLIELWGFVGPALYRGEKVVFWAFAIFSYLFFTLGSLFGYFVVFPFGFDFFLSLSQPGEIMPSLSVGGYLDFTLKLFLAFGMIFELPLVVFILSRLGIVTPELMLKQMRLAMVTILIASAVLTPPDPFTMLLMAAPLTLLYLISIVVSFLAVNRKKAALRAQGLNPEEFG